MSTFFAIAYTVSGLVSIGFLIYLMKDHVRYLIHRIANKKIIKDAEQRLKEDATPPSNNKHAKKLHDLRGFHYIGFENIDNISNDVFFIGEAENEALGMFVSVSPELLRLLTKLESSLINMEEDLTAENPLKHDIKSQISKITDSLDALKEVTETLFDKIRELYESNFAKVSEVPIQPEVVKGYIGIASSMLAFAFNYIRITGIIRHKLTFLKPGLEKNLDAATSKFLNIFFIDLVSCIGLLDESIEVIK